MLNVVGVRGRGESTGYPQAEEVLGGRMLLYSQRLGPASEFGTTETHWARFHLDILSLLLSSCPCAGAALACVGEALQQVGQARDVQDLHNTQLREIRVRRSTEAFCHSVEEESGCLRFYRCSGQFQLKKLNGRRLDFDYKKRRRGTTPVEELRQAQDKLVVSKEQAERSMFNLLQNDVSQWCQTQTLPVDIILFVHYLFVCCVLNPVKATQ